MADNHQLSPGAQFGAMFAFGWLINKIGEHRSKKKVRKYYWPNSTYSIREHIELNQRAVRYMFELLDLYAGWGDVDPAFHEETKEKLVHLRYVADYEIPEDMDPDGIACADLHDHLLQVMMRGFHDLYILYGGKICENILRGLEMKSDEEYHAVTGGIEIQLFYDKNEPYTFEMPLYGTVTWWSLIEKEKEDLLPRLFKYNLLEKYEERLKKAKTYAETDRLSRSYNNDVKRIKFKALGVPESEYEPMIEKIEKLPLPDYKTENLYSKMLNEKIKLYRETPEFAKAVSA